MPKIVDAFLFFSELDLLRARLRMYSELVNYFVLVESPETFSGNPKPFVFEEHSDQFTPWGDKIVYCQAPRFSTGDPWAREAFQRNQLAEAIKTLNLDSTDVILLSDVDEFPHPSVFSSVIPRLGRYGCIALEQELFYYSLQWKKRQPWRGTVVVTHEQWTQQDPETWRQQRERFDFVPMSHGGWHLSYFGDTETIQEKIQAFSHQEFNKPQFIGNDNIERCVKTGKDLFHRSHEDLVENDKPVDSRLVTALALPGTQTKEESHKTPTHTESTP